MFRILIKKKKSMNELAHPKKKKIWEIENRIANHIINETFIKKKLTHPQKYILKRKHTHTYTTVSR